MNKKTLTYIYPLAAVILLAIFMLRPNFLNLIPYTIYHSFEVSSMNEAQFTLWFDLIFLVIMYVFFFRVTKQFLNWKNRNHLQK
ncbi:hypothetical protein [Labilibacter marinus]|uniref:hypothetical protein n=1 Tax=Labilibacter marinus TaxID=1477105 RepID=UPI000835AAD4|nr:hypothetical protein [Labilibacter marinus]